MILPRGKSTGAPSRSSVLWFIWWLVLALVVVGSLLPGSLLGSMYLNAVPVSDKFMHFGSYLVLASLPVIASAARSRIIAAAVSLALLGLVLEFAQRLVPGRSFDLGDFLADALGVLAGLGAGWLVRKMRL